MGRVSPGSATSVSLGSVTISGTVPVTNAGLTELAAAINGSSQVDVNIAASGATVPVSGTFWQATQPVSGTVAVTGVSTLAEQQTQTTALGTLLTSANFAAAFGTAGTADSQVMSIQGIASMTPVQVSQATAANLNMVAWGWDGAANRAIATDNAGNIQVDILGGTVDLGATDNAVLDTIAASVAAIDTDATTIIGHVDGLEALIGTTNTNTAASTTALQLIDNAVSGAGFNITQLGGVNVSMNTGVRDTGTQRVTIATNDSVPVTFTGSTDVATQTTLASALTALQLIDNAVSGSGFNITQMNGEAIDVGAGTEAAAIRVTLPTNGTGILAGVTTVTTVTTLSTLTGGGVAHDSGDSGNPVKVGAKAFSPDGTTPGTAVAENDRSDLKTDLNGRLLVNTVSPQRGHTHLDGSSAYTDQALTADPGDGFQVIITSIIVSTGAATAMNFFIEEGASKIFGPIYLEATAGRGFSSGPINLPVTASTASTITTSAAIAQSVDVDWYIQAV